MPRSIPGAGLLLIGLLSAPALANTDLDTLYTLSQPPPEAPPQAQMNPTSAWRTVSWQDSPPPPTSPLLRCPAYCASIEYYSQQYRVPKDLVIAQIYAESNFNPGAVSPKGAKGLMQLMDVHSRQWNINPFNPDQNIQVGTAHLARLLKKYRDVRLALAAYNAGEGNVRKYGGIPPFRETQQYIARIEHLLGGQL